MRPGVSLTISEHYFLTRTASVRITSYRHRMTNTPNNRRWAALGVLALIQFMLVLDITVVNVALPRIKIDLGFSSSGLAWVVDGYVLTAGGLLLLGGRLADLLGRRRMFVVGVGLFAVASAVSGAAVDPAMLVASRFAQGAAQALAGPAAFGLVALLFPDAKERAKAIGIFGGVAGLGGTLGPVISGLILQGLSWRWIFYINVPVAVLTLLAVRRTVDESRASAVSRSGRPDLTGAALATGALTSVVYGLIQAGAHGWSSLAVIGPVVIGVAGLAAFMVRERTAASPLVPRGFFTNRTRMAANLVTLLFSAVFFTLFYLLTLYFQDVLHYSALRTGLYYLPFGVGISAGIGVSSRLVTRAGVRTTLIAGFLMGAAGMGLLTTITADGSYVSQMLPGMVLTAFGSGLCFAGFSNAAVHAVSGEDASLASGVQTAVQQVGGAMGLAVLATVALRHALTAVHHGINPGVAATAGTVIAFRAGAVILVLGAAAVAVLVERLQTVRAAAGETVAPVAA
jgi:EmrB/QacA subfamily drug resistance transporter